MPAPGRALPPEYTRRQHNTEISELVGETRPHTRRLRLTEEPPARVDACAVVEQKGILQGDDLTSIP